MLRRLSDVTIGSIEKFLKIGNSEENGGKNETEKKRKLTESVCEENFYGSRLRRSKGQWDLSTDESIAIDLDEIDSSELPSDLSINGEDWTDFLNLEDDILLNNFFDSDEVYKNMKHKEKRGREYLSKETLFKVHTDLTHLMRAKLINWIFEVAVHYKLQRETIYSTQILLDSFLCLTRTPVPRTKFQLIGLACLLISAKLEEVRPPNLTDLSVICDEMFLEAEIAAMELEICSTLRWHLTPINTLTWLRFYMSRCEADQKQSCEGKLDFLIHSSRILNFPPSKLAAALMTEIIKDPDAFEHCTGYNITDLQEELQWISTWKLPDVVVGVAYVDPKELKTFTEDQFDEMIENHRKSLNFIVKQLKLE